MTIVFNALRAMLALFVPPLAGWIAIRMGWTPEQTGTFIENLQTVLVWICSVGGPSLASYWLISRRRRPQETEGGADA